MAKKIIGIGFIVFVLLTFGGCASSKPVNLQAANELARLGVLESVADNGGFLFFVSKQVRLTRTRSSVGNNASGTTVRREIARETVNLKENTPGRVQGGSPQEGLEIGFEKLSDGSIPTIKFIMKNDSPNKYYFSYEEDGTVRYGDDYYSISYKGVDQPYLLYKQVVKTTEKSRNIGGLR
jgi:hypothetical protein